MQGLASQHISFIFGTVSISLGENRPVPFVGSGDTHNQFRIIRSASHNPPDSLRTSPPPRLLPGLSLSILWPSFATTRTLWPPSIALITPTTNFPNTNSLPCTSPYCWLSPAWLLTCGIPDR